MPGLDAIHVRVEGPGPLATGNESPMPHLIRQVHAVCAQNGDPTTIGLSSMPFSQPDRETTYAGNLPVLRAGPRDEPPSASTQLEPSSAGLIISSVDGEGRGVILAQAFPGSGGQHANRLRHTNSPSSRSTQGG